MHENLVIVRGGGDIASGTIEKLHKCGFNVLILEVENPSSIRRKVCYGEAVYTGEMEIEGIKSKKIKYLDEINKMFEDVDRVFSNPKFHEIIIEIRNKKYKKAQDILKKMSSDDKKLIILYLSNLI